MLPAECFVYIAGRGGGTDGCSAMGSKSFFNLGHYMHTIKADMDSTEPRDDSGEVRLYKLEGT